MKKNNGVTAVMAAAGFPGTPSAPPAVVVISQAAPSWPPWSLPAMPRSGDRPRASSGRLIQPLLAELPRSNQIHRRYFVASQAVLGGFMGIPPKVVLRPIRSPRSARERVTGHRSPRPPHSAPISRSSTVKPNTPPIFRRVTRGPGRFYGNHRRPLAPAGSTRPRNHRYRPPGGGLFFQPFDDRQLVYFPPEYQFHVCIRLLGDPDARMLQQFLSGTNRADFLEER